MRLCWLEEGIYSNEIINGATVNDHYFFEGSLNLLGGIFSKVLFICSNGLEVCSFRCLLWEIFM